MRAPGIIVDEDESHPRMVELQQQIFCRSLSGVLDADTRSRLRGWQRANNLAPTGVVDAETAAVLGWN